MQMKNIFSMLVLILFILGCDTKNNNIVTVNKYTSNNKGDWKVPSTADGKFKSLFPSGKLTELQTAVANCGINCKESHGYSFLQRASAFNKPDMVQYLISQGADLDDKENFIQVPILSSALKLENSAFEAMLKAGANPNITNEKKVSPLMDASIGNNIEKMKLLIEYGANVDLLDEDGHNALFYAVSSTDYEPMILLYNKGADLNIKNNKGENILHDMIIFNRLELLEKYCYGIGKNMNESIIDNMISLLNNKKTNEQILELLNTCKVNRT
jgi:ankyrin repeat protein